jgi:cytochrome c5
MAKKKYVVHTVVISGFSLGVALFAYLLVTHHMSMPNQVMHSRDALMRNGSSVIDRIKPVGKLAMELPTEVASTNTPISTSTVTRDGAQVFDQSCAACHSSGIAGAPKLGDQLQWKTRLAKGTKVLYVNALNGISSSTGVMPAKGGNPSLDDFEITRAVVYMTNAAGASFPEPVAPATRRCGRGLPRTRRRWVSTASARTTIRPRASCPFRPGTRSGVSCRGDVSTTGPAPT